MELIPVLSRIIARYGSGALVAYGIIPHEAGAELAMDPEVALIVGAVLGAAAEGFYVLARRLGWAK